MGTKSRVLIFYFQSSVGANIRLQQSKLNNYSDNRPYLLFSTKCPICVSIYSVSMMSSCGRTQISDTKREVCTNKSVTLEDSSLNNLTRTAESSLVSTELFLSLMFLMGITVRWDLITDGMDRRTN